ncbi:MAG TPA: response regulator transcription factor [Casimicrobiaceae bacterium]
MIDGAARPKPEQRLRVAIRAPDPAREARLRAIMLDAGHDVVDAVDLADVVLADGDAPGLDARAVVTLGGMDTEHAGVLSSDADASQIDAAVRAVASGLIVRAPSAAPGGFGTLQESRLATLLTAREIEVLDAIVAGLPNKAIAQRLDISLHTVKFHVEALFRKLGVRTRTEAAARAWAYRGETIEL